MSVILIVSATIILRASNSVPCNLVYNPKLKHQKMKMPSTMKGPVFIYNIVQDMRLLYLNLVPCKIDRFHIQLHHVPDNKLYLLAVAMTLAQLLKILLARDS